MVIPDAARTGARFRSGFPVRREVHGFHSREPTRRGPVMTATDCGTIAHLGTVELGTPELEGSVWSFVEILGMTETGRRDGSVFLRTFDNFETTSLILTERKQGQAPEF